jgi:virulence factor BrkB
MGRRCRVSHRAAVFSVARRCRSLYRGSACIDYVSGSILRTNARGVRFSVLFLLALASFFLSNITDDVGRSLSPFVSPQVLELIQQHMRRLANNESGGLLTFGVAGALWSSSAALVSVVGALNRAYDIRRAGRHRPMLLAE